MEYVAEYQQVARDYNLTSTQKLPQSHRGDAHKIEFFRNATVGCTWETEPLSRIATHGLTVQQLYGELEAAPHLQREAQIAVMRDSATRTTKRSDGAEQKVPGILYQGQGRYLNRQNGLGARSQRRIPQKISKTSIGEILPSHDYGLFSL